MVTAGQLQCWDGSLSLRLALVDGAAAAAASMPAAVVLQSWRLGMRAVPALVNAHASVAVLILVVPVGVRTIDSSVDSLLSKLPATVAAAVAALA